MNRRSFLLSLLAAPAAAAGVRLVSPVPRPLIITFIGDHWTGTINADLVNRYIRPATEALALEIDRKIAKDWEAYVESLPTETFTLNFRT